MLPAFRGFNAIKRTKGCNVIYQGATLHTVDKSIDDGEIIAKIVYPIDKKWDIEAQEKLSFLQKVILATLFLENDFGLDGDEANEEGKSSGHKFVNPPFYSRRLADYFSKRLQNLL